LTRATEPCSGGSCFSSSTLTGTTRTS
jgi:hypothetical protein